ncbi:hypothetical protein KC842_02035 [Candidatus Nomurabacteria bacterium]|nr:hypothetical protein [Candidatus Nomurabacteria bacterium]USN94598.1 MAG: hypothetical protein H6791_02455 [Candidatus Nomurabacteria bacterium]
MEPQDNRNNSKIDALSERLYSLKDSAKRVSRSTLAPIKKHAPRVWEEVKKEADEAHPVGKTSNIFKKIFFVAAGFLVVAILIFIYTFFFGNAAVSNEKVEINITGSTYTNGGETLPITIEVINRNPTPLELVDLILSYPKGSVDSGDLVRERETLGDIKSGQSVSIDKEVVLFGEIGSARNITATLEYRLADSNAVFVKEAVFPVIINSAPIDLVATGPENVVSGEKFIFDVILKSESEEVLKNAMVVVEYPFGFSLEESTPEANFRNNVFLLGDIPPGTEKKISITGKIEGSESESRGFRIYAGEQDPRNDTEIAVSYSSFLYAVDLVNPFVDASIIYGGQEKDTYTVSPNETLFLQLKWTNNSPVAVTDASITVSLGGNALDKTSIKANSGFYNSNTNSITWSKDTLSELGFLEPGESGSTTFSLKSIPLSQTALEDPQITLNTSVKGNQLSIGESGQTIDSVSSVVFKLTSEFQVSGTSLYTDSPISNQGPVPPVVGEQTTYTVRWSVSNSSNPLESAVARTFLPSNVTWEGVVYPNGEDITYNEANREVVWNIGDVQPNTGFGGTSKDGYFKVSVIPSSSQVGSFIYLTDKTSYSGYDTYSGASISKTWPEVTTKLVSDSLYGSGSGNVTE